MVIDSIESGRGTHSVFILRLVDGAAESLTSCQDQISRDFRTVSEAEVVAATSLVDVVRASCPTGVDQFSSLSAGASGPPPANVVGPSYIGTRGTCGSEIQCNLS